MRLLSFAERIDLEYSIRFPAWQSMVGVCRPFLPIGLALNRAKYASAQFDPLVKVLQQRLQSADLCSSQLTNLQSWGIVFVTS